MIRFLFGLAILLFNLVLVDVTALEAKPPYHPEVLLQILKRVDQEVEARAKLDPAELKPLAVVFDLDDTLFLSRSRVLLILRKLCFQPEVAARFPEEVRLANEISVATRSWTMTDFLQAGGVKNSEFIALAEKAWRENYFSSEFAAEDAAVAGGRAFVQALADRGVHIIYVSGRDIPHMKEGTIRSLRQNGFPLGERTQLLLKPDARMKDIDFKPPVFQKIAEDFHVVAAFENEPVNANAYVAAFPKATVVFLDTAHSPGPVEPLPSIFWVMDYVGPWSCQLALVAAKSAL